MFSRREAIIYLIVCLYGADLAWSMPAEPRGIPRPNTEVQCDPISKYTTSFFENNFVYLPKKDFCLFYTRGLSEAVQINSNDNEYTTIWDLFACDLYKPSLKDSDGAFIPYDPSKDLENPRRCIFTPAQNDKGEDVQSADELTYFSNMSEAMALWCDGTASVMNENAPDLENGVWANVEFKALQKSGNPGGTVNIVNKVDRDLKFQEELFNRGGTAARDITVEAQGNETSIVTKRATPRGKPQVRCLSAAEVAAVDLTPW